MRCSSPERSSPAARWPAVATGPLDRGDLTSPQTGEPIPFPAIVALASMRRLATGAVRRRNISPVPCLPDSTEYSYLACVLLFRGEVDDVSPYETNVFTNGCPCRLSRRLCVHLLASRMRYTLLTGMAPWRDHELATHLSDAGVASGGHDGERSGGAATSVLVSDPAEDGRARPSAFVEELRVALAMMTAHSPAVEGKSPQMVMLENVGVGGGEGRWNGEHARSLRLLSRAAVLALQLSGVDSELATGCDPYAPARGRRRLDKSARGRDDIQLLSTSPPLVAPPFSRVP
jgi:hypothetical protein